MELRSPFVITSRLLPGVQIGSDYISIEYAGTSADGRTIYRYHIDYGGKEYSAADMKSGVGGGDLRGGMESLLSFLGAAAESWNYQQRTGRQSENLDLFPADVAEWAAAYDDVISTLQLEVEEAEDCVIE